MFPCQRVGAGPRVAVAKPATASPAAVAAASFDGAANGRRRRRRPKRRPKEKGEGEEEEKSRIFCSSGWPTPLLLLCVAGSRIRLSTFPFPIFLPAVCRDVLRPPSPWPRLALG